MRGNEFILTSKKDLIFKGNSIYMSDLLIDGTEIPTIFQSPQVSIESALVSNTHSQKGSVFHAASNGTTTISLTNVTFDNARAIRGAVAYSDQPQRINFLSHNVTFTPSVHDDCGNFPYASDPAQILAFVNITSADGLLSLISPLDVVAFLVDAWNNTVCTNNDEFTLQVQYVEKKAIAVKGVATFPGTFMNQECG